MTCIGVISDTHAALHDKAQELLSECDYIIHAGDICSNTVLTKLKNLAPTYAVLGNCDYPDTLPPDVKPYVSFTLDGVSFFVAHKPKDVSHASIKKLIGTADPQVRIHGHTHIPRLTCSCDGFPAELIFNPSSATQPREDWPRTIGKIIVEDGIVKDARIIDLSGNQLL